MQTVQLRFVITITHQYNLIVVFHNSIEENDDIKYQDIMVTEEIGWGVGPTYLGLPLLLHSVYTLFYPKE